MGSCKDSGANIRNVEVGFMGLEGSGFVCAVKFKDYLLPTHYRENALQGVQNRASTAPGLRWHCTQGSSCWCSTYFIKVRSLLLLNWAIYPRMTDTPWGSIQAWHFSAAPAPMPADSARSRHFINLMMAPNSTPSWAAKGSKGLWASMERPQKKSLWTHDENATLNSGGLAGDHVAFYLQQHNVDKDRNMSLTAA